MFSDLQYNQTDLYSYRSEDALNGGLDQTQQDALNAILSSFNASNVTQQDAIRIIEHLRIAGFQVTSALTEAMSEQGFDIKRIEQLSGVQAPINNGNMFEVMMDDLEDEETGLMVMEQIKAI